MSLDTVLNYFLRVGATFRRSESWKRQHTNADNGGRSRVLRSGRFGVGVLAAFLLGEEIEVETQHVHGGSFSGIRFRASIDAELLEMTRIDRTPGTTIRIALGPQTTQMLLGALTRPEEGVDASLYRPQFLPQTLPEAAYVLEDPGVIWRRNNSQLKQCITWPSAGAPLPGEWHRLIAGGYADVQWSYAGYGPPLACNGIPVQSFLSGWGQGSVPGGLQVKPPRLSIFDPDGRLNLSLNRQAVVDRLEFDSELCGEVVKDLLVQMIENPYSRPQEGVDFVFAYRDSSRDSFLGFRHQGFPGQSIAVILGRQGHTFLHEAFLAMDPELRVLIAPFSTEHCREFSRSLNTDLGGVVAFPSAMNQ